MIAGMRALIFGLALAGWSAAAFGQSFPSRSVERNPELEKKLHEWSEQERLSKEDGTWIYPWVLNSRFHCPLETTPHGDLEKRSNWTKRSLQRIAIFVPDDAAGIAPGKKKIELICGYGDGYERTLELNAICRFADTVLPVQRISERLPKPISGSIVSCDLATRTAENCGIHCTE